MSAVAIVKCDCKHDFQDKTYGTGNRVANVKKNNNEAVCTVCKTKHNITASQIKV